uniref:Uncharacterized protein n=1 Tax=Pararge aegeria TaxID=116150 RepID=S4PUI6_9NEOP
MYPEDSRRGQILKFIELIRNSWENLEAEFPYKVKLINYNSGIFGNTSSDSTSNDTRVEKHGITNYSDRRPKGPPLRH